MIRLKTLQGQANLFGTMPLAKTKEFVGMQQAVKL